MLRADSGLLLVSVARNSLKVSQQVQMSTAWAEAEAKLTLAVSHTDVPMKLSIHVSKL